MIKRTSIDAVIEAAKIEEVVGDYLRLKRRGANLMGNCPFHNEKTPSFVVSPAKNIYKCFGCGKAGHPIQFVMDHDNISFPDAIRQLAAKYRITLEEIEQTDEAKSEALRLDSLYLINQFTAEYYEKQMWDTDYGRSIGLQYIKERGFREDVIRKFKIGYAPAGRTQLLEACKAQKYALELVQSLGLSSKDGNRDFFQDRLIFPIQQTNGKYIAFAGRKMGKNDNSPKYINSPETEVYHKSKVLYGLNLAQQAIRKLDLVYIVEGYTDVMAMHQAGVENVVATSGTSLTQDHIKILKRHTKRIHFIFDGDAAGIKAALRGMDMVLSQDVDLKMILLPEGEDPDSFSKSKSDEELHLFLKDQAKDFILFKTDLLLKETANDPLQKAEMIKSLVESIAKIPDPIKRAVYIQQCSLLTHVDEAILVGETNKAVQKDIYVERKARSLEQEQDSFYPDETPDGEREVKASSPISRDEYQEKDLVRMLLTHNQKRLDPDEPLTVGQYIADNIKDVVEFIQNEQCKWIVKQYTQENQEKVLDLDYFIYEGTDEVKQFVIDLMTSPYEYSENWEIKKESFLQSQPKPEENQVNDAKQALYRFKAKKIGYLIDLNKLKIQEAIDNNQKEDLTVAIKVQQKLFDMRNEMLQDLGTVVIG